MCGLLGFIGESKDPELTFALTTKLFDRTETRGKDASGFWGLKDKVIYHKEPTPSSSFIKTDLWESVKNFNPKLLIAHSRGASINYGLPQINKNNHPFISSDKSLAVIHNGVVAHYEELIKCYEVKSECDSELLLRIIDSKIDRFEGIKEVWSLASESQMAVAVADSDGNLWLFRNKHRPLWVADLRETLGQFFFFSTLKIWETAISFAGFREKLQPYNISELPTEELWYFNGPNLSKFQIKLEKCEETEVGYFNVNKPLETIGFFSFLNDADELWG